MKTFSSRELQIYYGSLPSSLRTRLCLKPEDVWEQVTCSSTVKGKGSMSVSLKQIWAMGESQSRVSNKTFQSAGRKLSARSWRGKLDVYWF